VSQPNLYGGSGAFLARSAARWALIARPWTDLQAVKNNQSISSMQPVICGRYRQRPRIVKEIRQDLIRLDARTADLEASVRHITTSAEIKLRADD